MNMVEELSKSLKLEIKKVHLKNRLKTLKAHFSQYNDIFRGVSLSGFSWDPTTKLMNAEDEVWEALIKIDELGETNPLFENNDIGLENFNNCDDVEVTSEVKAPSK
ncbi:Myb/SANT-like domain-containing protein [Tanacetum coccineum]